MALASGRFCKKAHVGPLILSLRGSLQGARASAKPWTRGRSCRGLGSRPGPGAAGKGVCAPDLGAPRPAAALPDTRQRLTNCLQGAHTADVCSAWVLGLESGGGVGGVEARASAPRVGAAAERVDSRVINAGLGRRAAAVPMATRRLPRQRCEWSSWLWPPRPPASSCSWSSSSSSRSTRARGLSASPCPRTVNRRKRDLEPRGAFRKEPRASQERSCSVLGGPGPGTQAQTWRHQTALHGCARPIRAAPRAGQH